MMKPVEGDIHYQPADSSDWTARARRVRVRGVGITRTAASGTGEGGVTYSLTSRSASVPGRTGIYFQVMSTFVGDLQADILDHLSSGRDGWAASGLTWQRRQVRIGDRVVSGVVSRTLWVVLPGTRQESPLRSLQDLDDLVTGDLSSFV